MVISLLTLKYKDPLEGQNPLKTTMYHIFPRPPQFWHDWPGLICLQILLHSKSGDTQMADHNIRARLADPIQNDTYYLFMHPSSKKNMMRPYCKKLKVLVEQLHLINYVFISLVGIAKMYIHETIAMPQHHL